MSRRLVAYLQVIPKYPNSPGEGQCRIVGASTAEPERPAPGARVLKFDLQIPEELLMPVALKVDLTMPQIAATTGTVVAQ